MGCAVNGPGEAKNADIGIAGGRGEGLLIKNGEESFVKYLKIKCLIHWLKKFNY